MNFKSPTMSQKIRAIGSTENFPDTLRKALEPWGYPESVPTPQPDGWLSVQRVTGQSFDQFAQSQPNRPGKTRKKIYLQPLNQFPDGRLPLLDKLKEYAGAYFDIEVEVLPRLAVKNGQIATRTNPYTKNRQILAVDILSILRKNLPEDAFCLLAITVQDLYPGPLWNFVFGQASLCGRVGTYSFARNDPAFYGERRGAEYEKPCCVEAASSSSTR